MFLFYFWTYKSLTFSWHPIYVGNLSMSLGSLLESRGSRCHHQKDQASILWIIYNLSLQTCENKSFFNSLVFTSLVKFNPFKLVFAFEYKVLRITNISGLNLTLLVKKIMLNNTCVREFLNTSLQTVHKIGGWLNQIRASSSLFQCENLLAGLKSRISFSKLVSIFFFFFLLFFPNGLTNSSVSGSAKVVPGNEKVRSFPAPLFRKNRDLLIIPKRL